jgi:hypothetical protein
MASAGWRLVGAVHPSDLADAALGRLTATAQVPAASQEVARCGVDAAGRFDCALPGLEHGTAVEVRIEDQVGNRSEPTVLVTDSQAPSPSTVLPSDGTAISGTGGEAGSVVSVTDGSAVPRCSVSIGSDGAWTCPLTPVATDGDELTITEQDAAGNATSTTWRIGLPRVTVDVSVLEPGAAQTVTLVNLQPNETVTAVVYSDPINLGSWPADPNGYLTITWTVPADMAAGLHRFEITGVLSGELSTQFEVKAPYRPAAPPPGGGGSGSGPGAGPSGLPWTGSMALTVGSAAILAVLAGWFLIAMARRPRRG